MMETTVRYDQQAYHSLLQKHLVPHILPSAGRQKQVYDRKSYFFYITSYDDYLAARLLLNNNMLLNPNQHMNNDMLLQGCVMANTFIEKILKAHILFNDPSFSKRIHRSEELFDWFCETEEEPIFKILLNRSFIELLAKSYRTRYYDALKNDYNLYISYRRTITELDYTAFVLFNTLQFIIPPRKVSTNPYQRDFLLFNSQLFAQNYLLIDLDKTHFIEELPDTKLEFKLITRMGDVPVKMYGSGLQAYNDEIFDRQGIEVDIIEEPEGVFKFGKHHDKDVPHKSFV